MRSLFLFSVEGVLEVFPTLETSQQRQAVERFLIGLVEQFSLHSLHQFS